jgi:dipeptidyl aminopeptidase/acylaminoacyl peptidase
MRPEHIGALVAASDPRVAPDEQIVAYTRQTIDLEGNRYLHTVWTVSVGGGEPTPLVALDDANASLGRWSPDGTRLAYVARALDEDVRGAEVRVRDLATARDIIVCGLLDAVYELEWSPDGSRLAFVARDPDPAVYGTDDTPRKEKDTPARPVTTFFTRLDDEGWTYDRPLRVFVVDATPDAKPTVLTHGPYQAEHVAWSTDSNRVAFASARHDTWDLDLAVDLFVVAADGSGEPSRVTDTTATFTRPAWTSDDSALLALYQPDPRNTPHHARLVCVELHDGTAIELTDALDRNAAPYPGDRAPLPLPSGDVLFPFEDRGAVVVGRAVASGAVHRDIDGARWVTGLDARGDVVAFTASDATHPSDVHIVVAGIERRCTDHLAELTAAGAQPAPMERFVARSSDGVEVECWALRPAGDGPFPTLLNIHGGPFTQYGYKLFDEFQFQIAAGFGVICCNPRGSSGYSEAWGRAIRWPQAAVDPGTGWGGVDYDDIMACADAAIARFDWIDGDRIGVLGGSYGGYMTSWIVGHTDRFVAACSERAVNNLLTLEHNSDVASSFSAEIGSTYLEDVDAYTSRSPITYLHEMRTPLLILHSEHDLRCPINQADELFVGLRLLGRTPEFWRFPGEGHELSRSGAPRHRVQRAEILLDFFGRRLGTDV